MSNEIAAIPTTYKGVQFRSRTEARWAVFFDLCRIKWRYESIKVDTGYQIYIPDFQIQSQGWEEDYWVLVEIKGKDPTDAEIGKLKNSGDADAFILAGSPASYKCYCFFKDSDEWTDCLGKIAQCPFCGSVRLTRPTDSGICSCDRVTEFAERFDILSYFNECLDGRDKLASPVKSPILSVATDIAKKISFDSSGFQERLAREQELIDAMFSAGAFGSVDTYTSIAFMALQWKARESPPFDPSRVRPGIGLPGWIMQPYRRQPRALSGGGSYGGSDRSVVAAYLGMAEQDLKWDQQ